MGWIGDQLNNWVTGFFEEAAQNVMESFSGLFDTMVSALTALLAQTPETFNSAVYGLMRSVSQNVIMPVAGTVFSIVVCYELISMILDRNTLHELDTWLFFKWFLKVVIGSMFVSGSWSLTMSIFRVGSRVISGVSSEITTGSTLESLVGTRPDFANVGQALVFLLLALLCLMVMCGLTVIGYVVGYIWFITVYLYSAVAPLTFACILGPGWLGNIGRNYLKSLFALAFQGFFMMLMIGIYVALFKSFDGANTPLLSLLMVLGYGIVLVFMLFKSGRISKEIFDAH